MPELTRITLYADHSGDGPSEHYLWVVAWLERWDGHVRVADYSTGGWEHLWDVEAPAEAVAEVPEYMLCSSRWANSRG
jgi:hypothetical protein